MNSDYATEIHRLRNIVRALEQCGEGLVRVRENEAVIWAMATKLLADARTVLDEIKVGEPEIRRG